MGKVSDELKMKVVKARLEENKSYVWIEDNLGVLRGTTYSWVKRYHEETLFKDGRKTRRNYNDLDFLKKSFALLKKIRSQ